MLRKQMTLMASATLEKDQHQMAESLLLWRGAVDEVRFIRCCIFCSTVAEDGYYAVEQPSVLSSWSSSKGLAVLNQVQTSINMIYVPRA